MPAARRSISGPAVLATWVVTDRWHPAAACRATRARLPAPPPELARGPAHPPARRPPPPRARPPLHPRHHLLRAANSFVPRNTQIPAAPFYGPLVCPA